MASEEFKVLLERYLQGECTHEEEELVLKFYDSIQKGENEELETEQRVIVENKLWENLKSRIQENQKPSNNYLYYLQRIAASVLVLICIGAVFYFVSPGFRLNDILSLKEDLKLNNQSIEMIKVANDLASTQQVKLPDGSTVMLRPKSEIEYPEVFAADKREVYLEGEAFFDVSRDPAHPFLVYTHKVVTKVLGTSFNIKAYQDEKEITVAVRTGKVSVSTRNDESRKSASIKEEIILVPNQKAVYNKERELVSRHLVENPQIILSNSTLFDMEYDQVSVVKIFDIIEESYGINIIYDKQKLSNCILTTSLSDEGLYERIKIICEAIGAKYKIEDANIIIISSGCK